MLFDQIARNKRKTWLLLLVFFLLLGLVGYGVGYLWLGSGFGGLILALVIGFIYAVTMIFQSTNVVMAMNVHERLMNKPLQTFIMWLRIWLW